MERKQHAFTIMEILIVISIIAGAYVIVLPSLNVNSTTEEMDKLNRLASDVRSGFDLAVLNHKAFRIVFHLNSGKYWLETTEAENFYIGSGDKKEGDASPTRAKEQREEFDTQFEKYKSLAGETFKTAKGDAEIPPMSPVVRAKDRLQKPVWTQVKSLEWAERELTPQFIIKDIKVEHSEAPMTLEGRPAEENYAYLYFLPNGYVEKATIHLYYTKGDSIDESKQPWTIVTLPFRGEASLISGLEDTSAFNSGGEE